MKKYFLTMLLIIMSLFMVPNVKASIAIDNQAVADCSNSQPTYDASRRVMVKKCSIKLNVTDKSYLEYIDINITAKSDAVKKIEVTPKNGWQITSSKQDGLKYTYHFVSSDDTTNSPKIYGPNTSTIIGEFTILVDIGNEKDCGATIGGSGAGYLNRTCSIVDGQYFGSNGRIVSEEDYHAQCDKPQVEPPKCGYKDGTYYGPSGETLKDKEEFNSKCNPKCKVENGIYYDPDGHQVDKDTYDNKCNPKCEYKDGIYYDPNGHVVNKNTYDDKCNPKCEFKNGVYYDLSGHIVDKDTYDNSCNPKCKFENDKYYDKDGHEVSEEDYHKSCDTAKEETPQCKIENNKYYDKTGKEVTKDEYDKSCNPKCEYKDDKYYDNDGHEITKEEFAKMCPIKGCYEENDKYYDKNGNEVSKEAYFASCGVVENPKTGNILPYILIVLSCIGGIFLYRYNKKTKFYKL